MKKLMSLAIVFMLVLLSAIPAQAEKPLYGEMELEFNLGRIAGSPAWVGEITIDGSPYPMAFFNIGSGKPFVVPAKGSVVFFGEIWKIYDWMTFDFVSQTLVEGPVLLWGTDEGVVTFANGKYRMNGSVEGASGNFVGWEGRNVHMSGAIEFYPFGAPHFGPGTFRIN